MSMYFELEEMIDSDFEGDWAPEKYPAHLTVEEAFHEIMEEVYINGGKIDEARLHRNFMYLCEKMGLKPEHYMANDARDLEIVPRGKAKAANDAKLAKLAESAKELKAELCDIDKPVNITNVTIALKKMCIELECPLHWGQRVTVARESWQMIGRETLMDYAANLIRSKS